jgi:hypothetical protein
MKLFLAAGAMCLMLLLAGCSGLPAPQDDQATVALLPIQCEPGVNEVLFGRYSANIVSLDNPGFTTRAVLDPQADYQIITGLPEGSYKIDRITFYYNEGKNGSMTPADVRFSTHRKQITIINKQFQYKKVFGKDSITYRWISMITQTKAEEMIGKLKQDENFHLWELSDETKSIPEIRKALAAE